MPNDPRLAPVLGWVGRSHAEMNCWELIRAAYRLRGIELPANYHAALEARMFRTVFEPAEWDLVPISNHQLGIVNHVGLIVGEGLMIHSVQDSGVVTGPLTREPWFGRIAREREGERRRGYLRFRA